MHLQRKRHLRRQPTEELIRLALVDLVADAGEVDVQRMGYDWKGDDVLVQIHLKKPISGFTLLHFRREVAAVLRKVVPVDDPLQEWLVVIEYSGEELERVAPYSKLEDASDD
nr:hypothetical protein [uncultured Rhodoferax sp.]